MTRTAHASVQQGQVLVLGIVGVALLLLLFNRAFWLGDISAARMRQNSATDTAVYSAGVIQARLLNMLALLNRAYVAHHVASAHMATAVSWGYFSQAQAKQLSRANPPGSVVGMMFGSAHATAYRASVKAQGLGESLAIEMQRAAEAHADFTNHVFGRVQQNIQQHFFNLAQQNAELVLHRTYPELQAASTFRLRLQQWPQTVLATTAAQAFIADWVRATARQYVFLQPRQYTAKNRWTVSARCPHLRHQLRRRGETQLDDYAGWYSADTLSFHALRANRWVGCYYREYALGYAWIPGKQGLRPQGVFVENPPDDFSTQHFWRWVQEVAKWSLLAEDANPLASSYGYRSANSLPSARLQPVLVLATDMRMLQLRLEVEQHARTPVMRTQSAVAVQYVAPVNTKQRPNLFMPYWQPTLMPWETVTAVHGDTP